MSLIAPIIAGDAENPSILRDAALKPKAKMYPPVDGRLSAAPLGHVDNGRRRRQTRVCEIVPRRGALTFSFEMVSQEGKYEICYYHVFSADRLLPS